MTEEQFLAGVPDHIAIWCPICTGWVVRLNQDFRTWRAQAANNPFDARRGRMKPRYLHMRVDDYAFGERLGGYLPAGGRMCTANLGDLRVHLDREEVVAAYLLGGDQATCHMSGPVGPGLSFLGS